MRTLLTICVPLLCLAQAQDDECSFRKVLRRDSAEAMRLYNLKEYAKSAALLEALRRNPNLTRTEDERTETLYNLACDYSLAGEKQKAIEVLGELAAAGYSSADQIRRDRDFDNIRQEAGYKQAMAKVEALQKAQNAFWDSPALHTAYREELPENERIAGLSRLWAEAKYNFAFFDHLPGLDWDGAYLEYLPKVRATEDTFSYYEVLRDFYAQLHDGHTGVYSPREVREMLGYPAVSTRLVEDRIFIDAVRDPDLKELAGLELMAIDGIPVRQYGKERVAPHIGTSTQQDLDRRTYQASLLSGRKGSDVEVTLHDAAGKTVQKTLVRLSEAERAKFPRTPWKCFEFKMLAGGIAYVALNTFGDDGVVKDFEAAYPEIRNSNGIIFDVRQNGGGSSNTGYAILGYLTGKPFRGSEWRTRDYRPAFRAWGQPEKWHRGEAGTNAPHGQDPYTRPVVVLTGAGTFSAAEDFAVAFDAMKRGRIVGEPTGGSTGQPLMFALPGGGSARVCTKHDRYPDGKEFVGVGVQPDMVVHPTVADFRAGRDTVLEAALELLSRQR